MKSKQENVDRCGGGMKVLAVRWNSGVMFDVLTANGKPSQRVTKAGRKALDKACDRYREGVNAALMAADLDSTGYADAFRRAREDLTPKKCGLFLPLEPWGFASGTFDAPLMGDSGSTPTDTRALVLLCYQAPLNRIEEGEGACRFERIYEVQP